MKNSKQKQELIDSIKEMEDVYNDAETPADIKNSLEPSIKNAKGQLKELEQAEAQENTTVKAEKKVSKTATPVVKKKKAAAKKKAATTVRKVKKRITQKLPSIKAVIAKAKAELTKVKGRTPRGKEADASRKALPPGTRISGTGKKYREYRENRADLQRKKAPYLAYGGTVGTIGTAAGVEQIDIFGYETKYFPEELVNQFKKAVEKIEGEPDKEGMYYHNTSTALMELAMKVDRLILSAQVSDLVGVIGATLFIGVYNYKSGMHIDTDILRDCIARAFYDAGKKFARGGIVGSTELRRHVYEKMKNAGIDMEAFNQRVADVSWDVINGPAGLDEEYEGYVVTKDRIDDALQTADIPETLYYDNESGAVSESEPDNQEGEEWYEVSTKRILFGDLAAYFRSGGRIKSAINRDRKYKSDEPWEKKYHRKTRPRNPRYAAEGDVLRNGSPNYRTDRLYHYLNEFVQGIEAIAEDIDDKEDKEFLLTASWGAYPNSEDTFDELHEKATASISALYNYQVSDNKLQKQLAAEVNELKTSISNLLKEPKWFIYDEKKEKIIAAFLNTKEADKFVKDLKKQNPKQIVEGYSLAQLKKIGKDPLNSDNWADEMARGGKLKINKEYNWFVYNLHTGKILAGNEYREDADDAKNEIKEAYPAEAYTVYSAKYIQGTLEKDPYDSDNWSNPGYDKAFLGMTLINSIDNTLVASSQGAVAM